MGCWRCRRPCGPSGCNRHKPTIQWRRRQQLSPPRALGRRWPATEHCCWHFVGGGLGAAAGEASRLKTHVQVSNTRKTRRRSRKKACHQPQQSSDSLALRRSHASLKGTHQSALAHFSPSLHARLPVCAPDKMSQLSTAYASRAQTRGRSREYFTHRCSVRSVRHARHGRRQTSCLATRDAESGSPEEQEVVVSPPVWHKVEGFKSGVLCAVAGSVRYETAPYDLCLQAFARCVARAL